MAGIPDSILIYEGDFGKAIFQLTSADELEGPRLAIDRARTKAQDLTDLGELLVT